MPFSVPSSSTASLVFGVPCVFVNVWVFLRKKMQKGRLAGSVCITTLDLGVVSRSLTLGVDYFKKKTKTKTTTTYIHKTSGGMAKIANDFLCPPTLNFTPRIYVAFVFRKQEVMVFFKEVLGARWAWGAVDGIRLRGRGRYGDVTDRIHACFYGFL